MDDKEFYKGLFTKIKQYHKGETLKECCDFGEFVGFIFAPEDNDEPLATAYDCIEKATGKRMSFNPPDDFTIFDGGKIIPLEQVIE